MHLTVLRVRLFQCSHFVPHFIHLKVKWTNTINSVSHPTYSVLVVICWCPSRCMVKHSIQVITSGLHLSYASAILDCANIYLGSTCTSISTTVCKLLHELSMTPEGRHLRWRYIHACISRRYSIKDVIILLPIYLVHCRYIRSALYCAASIYTSLWDLLFDYHNHNPSKIYPFHPSKEAHGSTTHVQPQKSVQALV